MKLSSITANIFSPAYTMSDDRVDFDQLKALLCGGKDDLIQAIQMMNEGKVSTQDMADAILATKSEEFVTGFIQGLIDKGHVNVDNIRLQHPRSDEVKDNKPCDEDSEDKKPQDKKAQDGNN
ncbi:hypothetical protein PG984_007205 [Apiospora sp. TS-2023a]